MLPLPIAFVFLGLFLHANVWGEDADEAAKMAVPQITQREIFGALGLEVAKIRIVNIPPGKQVTVELVEWSERQHAGAPSSRRVSHLSVTPATDWIELLISAQKQVALCRRFNITIRHESPLAWEWPIDIEKSFGDGSCAVPLTHRNDFLNIGSNVYRYEGQRLQIAGFQLKGRTKKHYQINLNAFPEPPAEKKK